MQQSKIKNKEILNTVGKSKIGKSIIDRIKERRTEELVIAFCGPLGSGVSKVAETFQEKISECEYDINYIKASKFIKDIDPGPTGGNPNNFSKEAKRIYDGQEGGNNARNKYGNDILALLCIKDIALKREEKFESIKGDANKEISIESIRIAHIIDSLKHPDEVELLRSVYGNMFYLIGVLCAYPKRKDRLEKLKEIPSTHADLLMKRDESQHVIYGQKLIDTLQHADFFVRNNHDNVHSMDSVIERYIKLVLDDPTITPTNDEFGMYMAQSTALRSACISRQVGAAIMNSEGDIISVGCNDVPKPGGGLYSIEDGDNDLRCINKFDGRCWSVEQRERIKSEIKDILDEDVDDPEKTEMLSYLISNNTRIKDLLEFSRSVHAEMDAIVSIARKGGNSLKGCTLFCTTFPCHNCARHIIAAGIKKVYYIEPYEKSLALLLHDDAIELEPVYSKSHSDKVIFSHFEGVAPRKYLDLFRYATEKKIEGKIRKHKTREAQPKIEKFMDRFIDYEAKVIDHLKEIGVIKVNKEESSDVQEKKHD